MPARLLLRELHAELPARAPALSRRSDEYVAHNMAEPPSHLDIEGPHEHRDPAPAPGGAQRARRTTPACAAAAYVRRVRVHLYSARERRCTNRPGHSVPIGGTIEKACRFRAPVALDAAALRSAVCADGSGEGVGSSRYRLIGRAGPPHSEDSTREVHPTANLP